jgi:hypothetical protein
MSPVSAARLTCTTSVEVKMAYQPRHRSYTQLSSKVGRCVKTHLVRENEGKFYFVRYLGIPTTSQEERTWATSRNGGDETEGRHCCVTREVPMGPRKQRLKDETPETPLPSSLPSKLWKLPLVQWQKATPSSTSLNCMTSIMTSLTATMSFLTGRVLLRPALRSTSSPVTLSFGRRTLITLRNNLVCPTATKHT